MYVYIYINICICYLEKANINPYAVANMAGKLNKMANSWGILNIKVNPMYIYIYIYLYISIYIYIHR
jgi:hypothetical protein